MDKVNSMNGQLTEVTSKCQAVEREKDNLHVLIGRERLQHTSRISTLENEIKALKDTIRDLSLKVSTAAAAATTGRRSSRAGGSDESAFLEAFPGVSPPRAGRAAPEAVEEASKPSTSSADDVESYLEEIVSLRRQNADLQSQRDSEVKALEFRISILKETARATARNGKV